VISVHGDVKRECPGSKRPGHFYVQGLNHIMELFVIKTDRGVDAEQLKTAYTCGNVNIVPGYKDETTLRDAIPLTHFNVEKGKSIDPVALKFQHLHAWEEIVKRDLPYGVVVLDTVRLVDSFVKRAFDALPPGADLAIFSQSNMQINGVHLNGTDWVFLDSDDRSFNNICNAYLITQGAAKRLYGRKNELLNTPDNFALWINAMGNRMSVDRIKVFMSFSSTSSKPIYTKIS
jgi:hypothetical protein